MGRHPTICFSSGLVQGEVTLPEGENIFNLELQQIDLGALITAFLQPGFPGLVVKS